MLPFALAVILSAAGAAAQELPALPDSIAAAVARERPDLVARLVLVKEARTALLAKADAFDAACGHVEVGSAQDAKCRKDYPILSAQSEAHYANSVDFLEEYKEALESVARYQRMIRDMTGTPGRLGWAPDEQTRVATALDALRGDGSGTSAEARQAWRDVMARDPGVFAREAGQGAGPAMPTAGRQTNPMDCTIFALANAANLPYGVAAARAAKLIAEAEWRSAAEKANPQRVIEQGGLIGGEVVLLAEAFGQAEVVTSATFAQVLRDGRPILVNVVPSSGNFNDGHQVVLTKTFQHEGAPWYEMMDSGQDPQSRRYVSAGELSLMLKENGVAVRPEKGVTPALLR